MPERYIDAIVKFLAAREYQPLKPRQLARQMGVGEGDYGTFREAVKRLRDAGRIVLGAKNVLTLPEISGRVIGFFRANPRGFGFVIPETPNAHGDLFIPPDRTAGAMTGDRVTARVYQQGRREGERMFAGEIVEILQRGRNRFVGTLQNADGTWFVLPDGAQLTTPIVVRDISSASPKAGAKVVVEIVRYGEAGELPTGVIVEHLGEKGRIEVETLAVIRAHGLPDVFADETMADARAAVGGFDPSRDGRRENLAGQTVVTIDPDDARDFDDAISLRPDGRGGMILGVHIADVSHFVREGGPLDVEARQRTTSVYFPRRVVPMLPEILSNGVCSLQEGQDRFCLSAFIRYDADANVTGTRFAETVIRSAKRLTYRQAQGILDGKTGGYAGEIVELLRQMERLARSIEARRRKAGMLHLDLPEVELVFDADNKVVDAVPEDSSYTHTMIEMFMVEANEAVADMLHRQGRKFLRRIHPAPDAQGGKQLSTFARVCGHKLPHDLSRHDLQALLAAVKGRPESYAVNLAVLKTFQAAEYSPMQIGHFALASENYCHFTSPIRRYPDLTIHRLVREHCRGKLKGRPADDVSELTRLGEQCTTSERRAEATEDELREVLVLQFLQTKVGDEFEGVITGVTNFGLFVQSPQFLVEGLVRMQDLGDDWWEVEARYGQLRGERTGRRYRIGDLLRVRIAAVDVARRQLNLVPARNLKPGQAPAKAGKPHPAGKSKGKHRLAGKPKDKQPPAGKVNRAPGRNRNARKRRR